MGASTTRASHHKSIRAPICIFPVDNRRSRVYDQGPTLISNIPLFFYGPLISGYSSLSYPDVVVPVSNRFIGSFPSPMSPFPLSPPPHTHPQCLQILESISFFFYPFSLQLKMFFHQLIIFFVCYINVQIQIQIYFKWFEPDLAVKCSEKPGSISNETFVYGTPMPLKYLISLSSTRKWCCHRGGDSLSITISISTKFHSPPYYGFWSVQKFIPHSMAACLKIYLSLYICYHVLCLRINQWCWQWPAFVDLHLIQAR